MSTIKGFEDTINWYNENAEHYADAAKNLYFTPAIDKFVSLLPPSSEVLDAGCGSGRDSALLKDKGLHVTGIDFSQGLLEQATKTYPEIKFVLGNLLSLPFPDNSFDGVWSQASLVHLESPEDTQKAIQEFHRVLRKNGIVHILVKEKLTENKTAIVSDTVSGHDRFFQYYSKEEIARMLQDAGFLVLFIENDVADLGKREDTKWVWSVAKKQ